jgi:hypothetical protein
MLEAFSQLCVTAWHAALALRYFAANVHQLLQFEASAMQADFHPAEVLTQKFRDLHGRERMPLKDAGKCYGRFTCREFDVPTLLAIVAVTDAIDCNRVFPVGGVP